ncbi:MAG: helix-turn-helix domain-containing protein [Sphaerochaetaceae bacterium]|nr:helix-turn-helix domain-containing protein [Spirochaetales bacterium]MDY5498686.1 helix-turn-helix domain-containing protein [Sphaerochaetaceae bacterium]
MLKILIADDEFPELGFLHDMVARHFQGNAEIRCVQNGREAVDTALLWNADIALLDIEMPVMKGIEAAKRILGKNPLTRIIFITAYPLFTYAHEAVRMGASDYILKPVDTDGVITAVEKASKQIELQRQLEGSSAGSNPASDDDEGTDKASQLVAKIQQYIRHNYALYTLSLDSVSSILGMNASYLSSLFKKCTGVNFIDYVTDQRISAAKVLLDDPLRSTAEIASMIGYESASYFTRAFKKRTGMTPTEYRKVRPQEGGMA